MREQESHWVHFAGILMLGVIAVPLSFVTPFAMKIAVDSYLGDAPLPSIFSVLPAGLTTAATGPLFLAAGLVVLAAILGQAIGFGRKVLQTWTKEKLVLGFRKRLFPHVERLSLTYHDEKGASDSTFRVLMDTAVIPAIAIDGLIPFVGSFVLLVALSVVILMLSVKLALVALAVAPILFLISWPYGKRLRSQWHEIKEIDTSAMSLLQEVFSAVRVIKAFGSEKRETRRLIDVAQQSMDAKVRVSITQGKFDTWLGLFLAIGTATVVGLGFWQVKTGELSLGEFLMVAALLAQLYAPLNLVVGQIASMQSSLASAERAMHLLDEVPDVIERPDARALDRAAGGVCFDAVTFGYHPDHPVLQGVSFDVPAGMRVGIAGQTGAGKTTLMNLLTRLFDPDSGTVRLDDVDIRDLKIDDLRRQFSVVLQEPVLFSQSIADNIAYGLEGATRDQTIEAAKLANAHDFVSAFPDGYETLVGERGQRLSGGERQRISLARAFLKNAPILILDEPTSSVDMKTEAAIMEACVRLMTGRTTFIIAHRPSTLEDCDKVLVIENGRVVKFASPDTVGSLDELMLASADDA